MAADDLLPIAVLTLLLGYAAYYFLALKPAAQKPAAPAPKPAAPAPKPAEPVAREPAAPKPAAPKAKTADHARLLTTLKGFSEGITGLGLSQCGRHVVAASLDRTVRVFPSFDAAPRPNVLRANVPLDHATCVSISSTAKNVVVATSSARQVLAYSVTLAGGDVKPGVAHRRTIPSQGAAHKRPMVACLLASSGAFVLTVGGEDDTDLKLWSLDGSLLATHANKQGEQTGAALSADARFVMVAAMMSEVKCLEVVLDKEGVPTGLRTAMCFAAHRRAINAVAFADDCAHAALCSKDGGWSVWQLQAERSFSERHQNEDPKLRRRGESPADAPLERIALSPHGAILCGAAGPSLFLIDTTSGATLESIGAAHHPGAGISALAFASDGTRVASGAADGRIKLWRAADAGQAGKV